MAKTFFAPEFRSARVNPPGPGPISRIVWFVKSPAMRAILFVKFKSNKKF